MCYELALNSLINFPIFIPYLANIGPTGGPGFA